MDIKLKNFPSENLNNNIPSNPMMISPPNFNYPPSLSGINLNGLNLPQISPSKNNGLSMPPNPTIITLNPLHGGNIIKHAGYVMQILTIHQNFNPTLSNIVNNSNNGLPPSNFPFPPPIINNNIPNLNISDLNSNNINAPPNITNNDNNNIINNINAANVINNLPNINLNSLIDIPSLINTLQMSTNSNSNSSSSTSSTSSSTQSQETSSPVSSINRQETPNNNNNALNLPNISAIVGNSTQKLSNHQALRLHVVFKLCFKPMILAIITIEFDLYCSFRADPITGQLTLSLHIPLN